MPFRKYLESPEAQPSARLGGDVADLAAQLVRAASIATRARLLGELVERASSEAARTLAALLSEADPGVRAAGVEGLRRMAPEYTRPVLHDLLADTLPDIRIRALDVIERVPDQEIETWLLDMLEREESANVCGAALDVLAEMASKGALPAVRALRLRFADTPYVAFAAEVAIAQIAGG
jgi:HEAT repeat protein